MTITIHQAKKAPSTLDALVKAGSLGANAAEKVANTIRSDSPQLLLVGGLTGTGKTALAACIGASVGAKRAVVSLERVPELSLHRRGHFSITSRENEDELEKLEERLSAMREIGEDPVLLVDGDKEFKRWALTSNIAKQFTRVIITQSGSVSGTFERLRRELEIGGEEFAKEVSLLLYCQRVRAGAGARYHVEVVKVLDFKQDTLCSQTL